MRLAGTSALVAGGTSGLGLATAAMLVEKGAHVVVLGRDRGRGEAAAARIGAAFEAGDVVDDAAVVSAIERASAHGPLRALVVCAGVGFARRTIGRDGEYASAHDLDPMRRLLETNVVGTFNCVRLGATAISRTSADEDGQRGAVVLTASAAAKAAQVGQVAYATSKAAVLGMVLPLARDLAPVGIRVNAISPGGFETGIFGPEGPPEELRAAVAGSTIFPRRMGAPNEFATMALELLTNGYLNATNVDLDAGTRILPKRQRSTAAQRGES